MNEKYEAYKAMKSNLKKAMMSGFYYQAIFIEYAIIEDRTRSALKHAGVKYTESNGNELSLSRKLRKLRGNPLFNDPYVRKRLSLELLDDVENWKRERDQLIHALARITYNHESIKEIAETGDGIVKILDNKVKSTNRYFDIKASKK